MKIFALLLASAFAFGVSVPVKAEMKIGFVSAQKMHDAMMERYESLTSDISARNRYDLQVEDGRIPEMKKLFKEKFKLMGRSPSRAEQQEFDLEIQKKEFDLPQIKKKFNEDAQKRKNEVRQKLSASIIKAIANQGKQEKFSAVFPDTVVYVDPNCDSCRFIDITDKVIKEVSAIP